MSFAEHEESKNLMSEAGKKRICDKCGYIMEQKVARLNFKLEGQGWFGDSATCADPYGITEMEMRKNLEMEKRIEDDANNMAAKDRNTGEM